MLGVEMLLYFLAVGEHAANRSFMFSSGGYQGVWNPASQEMADKDAGLNGLGV